ncbi:hypothetical protein FOL47_004530, partial [Perkinsus chesapeaki]
GAREIVDKRRRAPATSSHDGRRATTMPGEILAMASAEAVESITRPLRRSNVRGNSRSAEQELAARRTKARCGQVSNFFSGESEHGADGLLTSKRPKSVAAEVRSGSEADMLICRRQRTQQRYPQRPREPLAEEWRTEEGGVVGDAG